MTTSNTTPAIETIVVRTSAATEHGDWTGWDYSTITPALRKYEMQRLQELYPGADIEIVEDSGMIGGPVVAVNGVESDPYDSATDSGTIVRRLEQIYAEFSSDLTDGQLIELGMRKA